MVFLIYFYDNYWIGYVILIAPSSLKEYQETEKKLALSKEKNDLDKMLTWNYKEYDDPKNQIYKSLSNILSFFKIKI